MKKFLAMLLAVALCLCVFACGNASSSGDKTPGGDVVTPGGDEKPGDDSKPDDNEPSRVSKLDKSVLDFWYGDTMYDETVLMVATTDADGNVTAAPKGKLMFAPTEILSVTQYNAPSTKQFDADAYTVKDGYLVANGEIADDNGKKVFKGKLPYVNDKALTGEEAFPGVPQNTLIPSKTSGLYLPFCEDGGIVRYQLYVTYKHAEVKAPDVFPAYQMPKLTNVSKLLAKKNDINLFVYGDSISTGANCSGYLQLDPNTDPWFKLVQKNLAAAYECKVNLTNLSVGGWTSTDGVNGTVGSPKTQAGLASQFKKKYADYYPDLAIIGFGMNDATAGFQISKYVSNIKSMIDTIRKQNEKCDIILLGTWLANPMSAVHSKNQTEFTQSLYGIADEYKNIIVVDEGKVHKALLDTGKCFTEMASNNVNHPNDFTTRMYASTILKALVK